MVDDGGQDRVAAIVRELLAAVPAGCTWLQPVHGTAEAPVDYLVAATSGVADIYGRGTRRVSERLSELYPSMVGGPLWQMYGRVLATGTPERLPAFEYEDHSAGVVASSRFDVGVARVLDGLLVSWQRMDESERRLART